MDDFGHFDWVQFGCFGALGPSSVADLLQVGFSKIVLLIEEGDLFGWVFDLVQEERQFVCCFGPEADAAVAGNLLCYLPGSHSGELGVAVRLERLDYGVVCFLALLLLGLL